MDSLIHKLVRKHKTKCPFGLAKSMNIEVWFEELPVGVRGCYVKTLRRRFISINNNLSDEWQKFVCAHELGHDRLHQGFGYYFIEQKTLFNPGKFERQANEFAIQLLLYNEPRDEDETNEIYLARNGVPREMTKYL